MTSGATISPAQLAMLWSSGFLTNDQSSDYTLSGDRASIVKVNGDKLPHDNADIYLKDGQLISTIQMNNLHLMPFL